MSKCHHIRNFVSTYESGKGETLNIQSIATGVAVLIVGKLYFKTRNIAKNKDKGVTLMNISTQEGISTLHVYTCMYLKTGLKNKAKSRYN